MFKRRPGKSDTEDASSYSRRFAATDSLWLAQDRARSGVGGALERLGFVFQERLIWPLQDRAATMGRPARALSGAAAAVLAGGAVAAGLLVAGSGEPAEPAPTQVAVNAAAAAAETKAPPPQPAEPTLKGAAPVFEPDAAPAPPSEVDPAKAILRSAPAAREESGAGASSAAASASSSKGPSVDGPPAGPQALAVAREFAHAFVLYETGETDTEVREAFAATATPALSRALLERPPRLPAGVEVPKAKVVNLVSAPSQGEVYPVSVSLLRVGTTSELRIEMEEQKGEGWRVTNVLG